MASKAKESGAADRGNVLFDLPISATGGSVVVTQPAKKVYLITFVSGEDNRLTSVSFPHVDLRKEIECDG